MTKRTYFYEVKFTVEGHGEFPYDMLRYDCCHPLSQDDVNKLENDNSREPRRVTLVSVKRCKTGPTEGRWNSFCWKVVEKDGGRHA